MVVDSCVRGGSRYPVALEYLTEIGVDPGKAVKLIVGTHWHDDHVRGLAQVVAACPDAEFACSAAMRSLEFLALTQATQAGLMMETSGVDEFREILSLLALRGSAHPKFVKEASLLLRRDSAIEVEIQALTPSDKAFVAALADIAKLMPPPLEPKKRIGPAGPNHSSVAVWMKAGPVHLLFGADLQEVPGRYWTRVLQVSTRPAGKASYFKLPHHGASNGDHPDVWRDLVADKAVAVVCPFRQGGTVLPSDEDVSRICSKNVDAYTTSASERQRPSRRDRTVERTMAEVVIRRSVANAPMGHVRARRALGDADQRWAIQAFSPAARLCK